MLSAVLPLFTTIQPWERKPHSTHRGLSTSCAQEFTGQKWALSSSAILKQTEHSEFMFSTGLKHEAETHFHRQENRINCIGRKNRKTPFFSILKGLGFHICDKRQINQIMYSKITWPWFFRAQEPWGWRPKVPDVLPVFALKCNGVETECRNVIDWTWQVWVTETAGGTNTARPVCSFWVFRDCIPFFQLWSKASGARVLISWPAVTRKG